MTEVRDKQAKVWEIAERIGVCMLTTIEGRDLRSRPMAAHPEPIENAFYFLMDARSPEEEQFVVQPMVGLAFADLDEQKFLSVSGKAQIVDSPDKIRDLWDTAAKAWWDSPDNPDIRVLRVTPHSAEYWAGPGKVASAISMAVAAISGGRPSSGDNAKVAM